MGSVKRSAATGRAMRGVGKTVGRRIEALRTERGWTQKELARRLCVSHQQVGKYERGTNHLSLEGAVKAARIFNTTLHDLVGFDEKEDATPISIEGIRAARHLDDMSEGFRQPLLLLICKLSKASPERQG